MEAATFDEPRSVKTSALPLDLLARLSQRRGDDAVRRHARSRGSWLRSPWWLVAALGVIGLAAYAIVDSPYHLAFALPVRPLFVAGAVFLVLAWLVRRQVSGFLSPRGEHLVLGETSLVIVSARHVRIFPAEYLSTTGGIFFKEELLDHASHSGELTEQLTATIARAKDDPAARAADRFRIAALKYDETIAPSVLDTIKRLGPLVLLAIAVAVFVEAQPLHARARRNLDARHAAWDHIENELLAVADGEIGAMPGVYEVARRNEEAAQKQHDADVAAAEKLAADELAAKVARDAITFKALLAPARKGDDEDAMRAFLRFSLDDCAGCDAEIVDQIKAKMILHCTDRVGRELTTDSLNAIRAIALHACLSTTEHPYWIAGSCTEDTADVCKSRIDDVKEFASLVEPKSPMPILPLPTGDHRFKLVVLSREKHVGDIPSDKFQAGSPEDVTYQLIVYSTPLVDEETFTITTIWFLTTTWGGAY